MANKYTEGRIVARMRGMPCAYCKRTMDPTSPDLMPTRDHIHPRSKGGRRIVWACWTCNHMKGDMTLEQWTSLMAAHPRWWHGVPKKQHQKRAPAGQLAVIPYAESMFILKHGKKAYRAWKAGENEPAN